MSTTEKHEVLQAQRGATLVDLPSGVNPNQSYTITNEQLNVILDRLAPSRPPHPRTPRGNPGPQGRGPCAVSTVNVASFNTGVLIDASLEKVVLPLALFYGGLAQFAAGMWEYKTDNTFGATAFSSYGAFWMSFAAYVYLIAGNFTPALAHYATGLYLLAWTFFTFYMWIASFRTSMAVFAVFTGLFPTFLLLAIGNLVGHTGTIHAGGWFGLYTAFAAWYASAAVTINSTFGREVCPVGAVARKAAGVTDRDLEHQA
ncbi:hypothetical protein HDV00_005707 [Rhizophlyctis rosea]|nr:hypothetical protein HDV00_005707 [Rhizophlyctis rosea]